MELPLARAAEMVLGSMQSVLWKTKVARDEALEGMGGVLEMEGGSEKRVHLRKTKAAEVRVVRNLEDLRAPERVYRARAVGEEGEDVVGGEDEGDEASGGMNPR